MSRTMDVFRRVLTRWLISFALVAGFMCYHSMAPIGAILLAGIGTLILNLAMVRRPR